MRLHYKQDTFYYGSRIYRSDATGGGNSGANPVFLSCRVEHPLIISVFPSLEHSRGVSWDRPDNLRTFVAACPLAGATEHNITARSRYLSYHLRFQWQMITVRFARFVLSVKRCHWAPESPLIVCVLSDTPRDCQTWKTQNSMFDAARKSSDFASKLPPLFAFWNFIFSNILIIKHIRF